MGSVCGGRIVNISIITSSTRSTSSSGSSSSSSISGDGGIVWQSNDASYPRDDRLFC